MTVVSIIIAILYNKEFINEFKNMALNKLKRG